MESGGRAGWPRTARRPPSRRTGASAAVSQEPAVGRPRATEAGVDLADVPDVRHAGGAAAAAPPSTTEVLECTSATPAAVDQRPERPCVAGQRAGDGGEPAPGSSAPGAARSAAARAPPRRPARARRRARHDPGARRAARSASGRARRRSARAGDRLRSARSRSGPAGRCAGLRAPPSAPARAPPGPAPGGGCWRAARVRRRSAVPGARSRRRHRPRRPRRRRAAAS